MNSTKVWYITEALEGLEPSPAKQQLCMTSIQII